MPAAWVLTCQPHDVPILVAAYRLKPLGNPDRRESPFRVPELRIFLRELGKVWRPGAAASFSYQCALGSATSGRCCSGACSVFKAQPQPSQPQVHGGSPKAAVHPRSQFG